ncbi:MAG: hypothetical protein L6R42_003692, partial [Xanthoria sp. 1 TBL-2021]
MELDMFRCGIHVASISSRKVSQSELSTVSDVELPRRLEIGKAGLLQTLQWVQGDPIVLPKDEVEVEPCAVGLNFKDILVCMDLVDAAKAGISLEGAGIVRNIGADVENLKVGDRVIIFEHGCFSTRLAISAKLCASIPDELSFEEAATLPCIFATVGNDAKKQYLIEKFGISHDHIFNSRNESFLPDVKRATNGRGVDIVLNSLSGELLHASWKCVAEYGKMLEIGKRDFVGRGLLSMDLFEANRAFFGIDLARLGVERPEACRLLLEQCMDLCRQGKIAPITPMKVFEAAQIVDAFKYMQKGQHIGKIVVTMPSSPKELSITPVKQELRLRPEASYLLVGGLGGLGRAITTWMVEHGARHLIFLYRSAGTSEQDEKFFHELNIQGCSVQACRGSVTDIHEVSSAIDNSAAPIAGVMHMSMVLKDRGFLEFTHDEWNAAVAPKVKGAWNLHKALLDQQLDFFVLFSSISAIVGQWGQGNYAAANTFLDSFVQYRQSLGLPASAININVMEDVGYVSQNPAVLEQFKATSAHTLREQDLMDALQLVMGKSAAEPSLGEVYSTHKQLVIGLRSTKPLSDPSNRAIWKRDVRMSMYRNLESLAISGTGMENETLGQFLAAVAKEPSMLAEQSNADFLTREIGLRLCNFMLRSEEDLDKKQPLAALGVDSLVAIEIRNWWRQGLGLEISILEIMNAESIEQLGRNALHGLQLRYEAPKDSSENNTRKATQNKQKRQAKATSNSAPAADTVDDGVATLNLETPQSHLLPLPRELREKIYAYLLDTKHARSPRPFQYEPWVEDGFLRLQATSAPFHICTEVLRANKQIHRESVNTLYSSNAFVRLSMYNDEIHWARSLLEETKLGFVCSNPGLLEKLKGHALDVRLMERKSRILRCQVVFPAIFLPRFLSFLQTMCDAVPMWAREHTIHLHLRQKYRTGPMATESLLLEPWRSLHGIQSVVVGTAIVAADYANGLRTAMMTQFDPEKWLQSVVKIKDAGIQEFSKGHYQDAIDNFANVNGLLESVLDSGH